jgi:bacillithiol biosynthesis cysteine-adding enzyme BshC
MLYQAITCGGRDGSRQEHPVTCREGETISLRIRETIDWAELLPPHHLLRDVTANDALSQDIFGTSPGQMAEHLATVRSRYRTRRTEVAAVLRRAHVRLGASTATLGNLDRLAQPDTFVVIGGQQPGLLTGPLYTIYKAISIIKQAEALQRQFPYEFVPLFWNASDDHDWAEVNHAYLVDGASRPARLEYPLDPQLEGASVGDITLDRGALSVIQRLSEILAGQGFSQGVETLLLETAEVSSTFGEWFSRLMLTLFERHGLIVVDPGLPDLKRLAIPLFEHALEAPLVPSQIANEAGDALEARGYQRQIHKDPTLCGFFIQENGRRKPVRYGKGVFHVGAQTYTKAELRCILDDSPERFSPNALLRPVMSEFLFPTSAFIGGAGELNYFAQTRDIYRFFDVPMPVPYLRLGCTLIDPSTSRILEKYQLPTLAFRDPDRTLTEWIRGRADIASPQLWRELREQVYRPVSELKDPVRALDPSLETSLEGTLNYMMFRLGRFEKKLVRHLKKAEHVTAAQFRRTADALFPDRGLQERMFNSMSYLSRYGMDLVERLVQTVPESHGKHYMVELS